MKFLSICTLLVGVSLSCLAANKIDIKKLKVGSAYRVSEVTPLMDRKTTRSRLAAKVEPLAEIPEGGAFRVIAVETEGGWPWYKVLAISEERTPIGQGYVDSTELRQQKVEPFGVSSVKVEASTAPAKPEAKARTHIIAASRDMNYKDHHTRKLIKRKEYKVKLAKEMSEEELKEIAEEVVEPVKDVSAVLILFYSRNSDPKGPPTDGKAVWAPNGKWEDAGRLNDKEIVVQIGPALGAIDKDGYVNYPVPKKKLIFYELVKYQDRGMSDKESCAATAKEYDLSLDDITRIAKEGAAKKWPMPAAKK